VKSIPKIYALGHRYTQDIFDGEVWVQEKIDGSQFSFSVESIPGGTQLHCFSKSTEINLAAPGMFEAGVNTVRAMWHAGQIPEGWTFQCEYLAKPKHNVLTYACIPHGHLVLFDVRDPSGKYCPEEVDAWAKVFDITPVPTYYRGNGIVFFKDTVAELQHCPVFDLVEHDSILGGTKIEGIVIKNYGKQHAESQSGTAPMTAKIVSDRFKEKHLVGPLNRKAQPGELIQSIVSRYRTEARWLKAIQHLKESGKLVNGPEDIGPLLAELGTDLLAEEQEEIKQTLFDDHWKQIVRGVSDGFSQYYKKLLAGENSQINKQ
jgi:hypothetical protein